MTRFLKPLANKVVIVSEISGSVEERKAWEDAVVFVDTPRLSEACWWLLQHPEERRRRAERARDVFVGRRSTDMLRGPITDLVRRSCPHAPFVLNATH